MRITTNNKRIAGLLMALLISILAGAQDDPAATEQWQPVPRKITPVTKNTIPSDAVVLFNGKDLSQWQSTTDSIATWIVDKKGFLTTGKGAGDIQTRKSFASCQLHIEWRIPKNIRGTGQHRGNSGIFFMGEYELQILDSYDNPTYSNGQAGSIYKQVAPLVNASLKPGEWQVYDIVFTAPAFKPDGTLISPAKFTVLHNGVLIQNNVALKGRTVYRGQPTYQAHEDKKPLMLQDHDNPVSFRNIWIREL